MTDESDVATRSGSAPMETQVIEIAGGKLRGHVDRGVCAFKGIPYAQAARFMPPRACAPWAGIRDALAFGKSAPQPPRLADVWWQEWITDRNPQSEDCLVLNVYAPAAPPPRKKPVMVYFHGGAFTSGSSSLASLDGSNLARNGDVVVVTVNHRLNVFGFLHLAELAGTEYADSGNAGMLDLIAALQWVRDNIAAFGGDAGNVTLFGQSGGASKVAYLMASPGARGLFHKAIVQSGSAMLRFGDPDVATAMAREFCRQAGAPAHRLKDLPVDAILKARAGVMAVNGNVEFNRPVLDGRFASEHPFDPVATAQSATVPLLIGATDNEQTFMLGNSDANYALDRNAAVERIARFLGVIAAEAAPLYSDYAASRPGASPGEIMIDVLGDQSYRRTNMRAADLKAGQGTSPVYHYLVTWKSPALGGRLKSPHTTCLPFVFGTYDEAATMLGEGSDRAEMSRKMMAAWTSFVKSGVPSAAGLPQWTPYNAQMRPTMILDKDCRMENDPRSADRIALERFPLYDPPPPVLPQS